MNGQKKRLFIALDLPQDLRKKLEQTQNQLRRFALHAKWVNPAGIHLTLKFLGYVSSEAIPGILEGLTDSASRFSSLTVEVKGCGFFPNSRRPNVLWIGVIAPDLAALQADVEEAMFQRNFEKEKRPFHPHLTLARFKDPRGLMQLVDETRKWNDVEIGRFTASEIILFESILHRSGAEYKAVQRFPLPPA